jgi:hypothetical protein
MALIRVTGEVLDQTGVNEYVASYFTEANGTIVITENDVTINTPLHLQQTVEKVVSLTEADGNVVHDCTNTAIFFHTLVANTFTPNFTNLVADNNETSVVTLLIQQGSTAYMPSEIQIGGIGETVNWSEGITPSGSANKIDVVSYTLLRFSDAWIVLGQVGSFG